MRTMIMLPLLLATLLFVQPFVGIASRALGQTPEILTFDFPGPSRADLEFPLPLWDAVRSEVEATGRPLGYGAEEMAEYGRSTFLLPTVLRLFRDARNIPREAGRVTDELLEDAKKTAAHGYGWEEGGLGETTRRCYALLGESAGRRTMLASPADSGTSPMEEPFSVDDSVRDRWHSLPDEIRDLVCRLYRGAEEVRPWLLAAYDQELLRDITGKNDVAAMTPSELYPVAMAHHNDEFLDQAASLEQNSLRLFETTDLAYLGYATVLWFRHLEQALRAFHEADSARAVSSGAKGRIPERAGESFETFRLDTPLGKILIGGIGNDDHREPAFLVIDLGGNDRYGPGFAATRTLASPIAVLLDLRGNDRYIDPAAGETGDHPVTPSFGAGVFGIGVLCDLDGDDEYRAGESGLGRGCFGSGLLVDFAGNDTYYGEGRWTQGAAHAGIGVLLDLAGTDRYSCAQQSQGLGGTLGTGLLLDLSGDDSYTARDDGNPSELYLGQSVAMSQGCGYGRRADMGDGHSLAGGFGLLVDGAGRDDYHAQVWAQGCGYWWGVGILEDRDGNDRYRNGKYSSGAAAHFAIGLHVDLAGDDEYNLGNDTAKNQFQGHARDGSIGIFIDGDGADRYELRSHCGGSGDLASIGLFWDRRGDDRYEYVAELSGSDEWARTPPLGSTTWYEPFRSFRDDLPVYGIFLDTGGMDAYRARSPEKEDDSADREGSDDWGDDRTWTMRRNTNAWSLGMDASCF